MKLFIANTKRQDEIFMYRIPEITRPYSQTIPAGGQAQIYRDATRDVLEGIVDQHRMYGLVDVADIDRTKPFVNLCYQFDKAITQNQIMYGMEHNSEVLEDKGLEYRKQSAVAISSNLDKAAQEGNAPNASGMKLELIEEKTDQGDNSEKLTQTVEVVKDGEQSRGRGRGRPRNS